MATLTRPNGYWTKERVAAEAAKYDTRTEFQKVSGSAYNIACKTKIVDEVCAHMKVIKRPSGYWTFERVLAEAMQCSTKKEFSTEHKAAAVAASKNGWRAEIVKRANLKTTPNQIAKWTPARIKKEAAKYTQRSHFKAEASGAWYRARELNIMDEVCAHMELKSRKPYTFEELAEHAAGFNNLSDYTKTNEYFAASNLGFRDEITTHMNRDRPDHSDTPHKMYYLRVEAGDSVFYKVGITCKEVVGAAGKARFFTNDAEMITVLDVVEFDNFKEAHTFEQEVLALFAKHRVGRNGPEVLEGSGNTELFTRDVLGLDK